MYNSLQIFRGLAAFGVVIHHAALSTNGIVDKIPTWLFEILNHGYLGVDFFFVLSGFIIMNSHFDDTKSIHALKVYLIKRFVRIFPPYWPVSLVLIMGYFVLPGMTQGVRNDFSWLSSIFLFPDVSPPALSVAWTLIHELLFYIIFTIFFFSSRYFTTVVIIWVLAILSTIEWADGVQFSPLLTCLISTLNLEFVMGMVVAKCSRSLTNKYAVHFLILGFLSMVLLLIGQSAEEQRVMFGLPFSILILGTVLLERKVKLVLPRSLVLIGDSSYSIYLIHNPLLSLTSRFVARLHGFASWGLGMLVGIGASLFIGFLYHRFVEKPLIFMFRQHFK